MNLSRRAFLGALTAATAAAVASPYVLPAELLDPERRLWTPGAKTIFLPSGHIAVNNVRLATDAEIASLTGIPTLRLRHYDEAGREAISAVSEAAFVAAGHLFHGLTEIHFNNGGVAYRTDGPMTLDAARARAEAQLAVNVDATRQAALDRRARTRLAAAWRLREARREQRELRAWTKAQAGARARRGIVV